MKYTDRKGLLATYSSLNDRSFRRHAKLIIQTNSCDNSVQVNLHLKVLSLSPLKAA